MDIVLLLLDKYKVNPVAADYLVRLYTSYSLLTYNMCHMAMINPAFVLILNAC